MLRVDGVTTAERRATKVQLIICSMLSGLASNVQFLPRK